MDELERLREEYDSSVNLWETEVLRAMVPGTKPKHEEATIIETIRDIQLAELKNSKAREWKDLCALTKEIDATKKLLALKKAEYNKLKSMLSKVIVQMHEFQQQVYEQVQSFPDVKSKLNALKRMESSDEVGIMEELNARLSSKIEILEMEMQEENDWLMAARIIGDTIWHGLNASKNTKREDLLLKATQNLHMTERRVEKLIETRKKVTNNLNKAKQYKKELRDSAAAYTDGLRDARPLPEVKADTEAALKTDSMFDSLRKQILRDAAEERALFTSSKTSTSTRQEQEDEEEDDVVEDEEEEEQQQHPPLPKKQQQKQKQQQRQKQHQQKRREELQEQELRANVKSMESRLTEVTSSTRFMETG